MDKQHRKFSEEQPTIINDDGEAQAIMFELGVWDNTPKTRRVG